MCVLLSYISHWGVPKYQSICVSTTHTPHSILYSLRTLNIVMRNGRQNAVHIYVQGGWHTQTMRQRQRHRRQYQRKALSSLSQYLHVFSIGTEHSTASLLAFDVAFDCFAADVHTNILFIPWHQDVSLLGLITASQWRNLNHIHRFEESIVLCFKPLCESE